MIFKGIAYPMFKRNKRIVILYLLGQATIVVALMSSVGQLYSAESIELYLHKNAILALPPLSSPPSENVNRNSKLKPISPHESCRFAIKHLEAKGIKNIVICEVQWIAAPISGYLVDVKGKLTIDHQNYTTFRIGITDGYDEDAEKKLAGKEFVFIALGRNAEGKAIWYPSPGPDYKPTINEAMPESFFIYEFLLNRDRFETLFNRYP